MTIDFSQVITAEQKAAQALDARATTIKADCRARILDVASEATQMNIAQAGVIFSAAMLSGAPRAYALGQAGLQDGDLELAEAWRAWVAEMQAECRRAIRAGEAPVWPDLPEGIADLAARF